MLSIGAFAAAFVAGFVCGSLIEYWAHRAMHAGLLMHRAHMAHHASGAAKGVVPEFMHYALGTAWVWPWGFLVSPPCGWGWFAGALAYAFFSALGHQFQHDCPCACFWMRGMPVHLVHHALAMHDANFGLAVDWWDRVFGTYRVVEWDRARVAALSRGGLRSVRWI